MKVGVSTSLEEEIANRIAALAQKDLTSEAAIIRKCVARGLPAVEREILGEQFVQQLQPPEVVNG